MRERLPLFVLALAVALPAQAPDLPTARLEGVVVDPMQRPVVGAEVVVEAHGERRGRTFTDGEGTFVIARLPQDVVTVRATTKTPDIGGVWVDLLGLDRGFARVTLMPARKVTGIVKDRQGMPIAGAWVVSAPHDWADFALANCTTQAGADGRYELSHVPFGPVRLRAWAPDCDAGTAIVDGTADATLDLTVERDGIDTQTFSLTGADAAQRKTATLQVTAWNAGIPVPLPPPLQRVPFDADGIAQVRGWPREDTLFVHVRLPGAIVTPPHRETIANVNDSNWRFELGAEPERIRGQLVGNGINVGSRRVLAQALGKVHVMRRVLATTAADGSFDLASPVERGAQFALRVCGADVSVNGQAPDVCWHVSTHESVLHKVPVVRSSCVRLAVRSHDDSRVAGAEVMVYPALLLPRQHHRLDEPLHAYGAMLGRGTTDRDGSVTIDGLNLRAQDPIVCLVFASEGWSETIARAEGEGLTDCGTTTLAPGTRTRCTTLGPSGEALPGGRARVYMLDEIVKLATFRAADRNGELQFTGMPPGLYGLFSAFTGNATYQQLPAEPLELQLR